MKTLFRYNWQVRDEWFNWCEQVFVEELTRTRVGGAGSILHTLFHIVDVEGSWIGALANKPDLKPQFEDYMSVDKLRNFSNTCRNDVEFFLNSWTVEMENLPIRVDWDPGHVVTYGEVVRHVITHEIHHIGQLSVWSRELGLQPVSANFIGRNL